MKAMILAAGRGSRMGALTQNTPKPLLKIGKYHLIEWQIQRLAAAGIREFIINLAYLGEQIAAALGDGSRYGVQISYSPEPEGGLETAGGIIQALPLLGEAPFLVANADVWCAPDYRRFISDYQEQMLAHLLLVPTPAWKNSGDFDLAGERVIIGDTYTFAGISVIHPRLFAGENGGFLALAPFLRRAAQQGRLSGCLFTGQWQDVGTPERLASLQAQYQ